VIGFILLSDGVTLLTFTALWGTFEFNKTGFYFIKKDLLGL
jgi:hypothetical protein